MPISKNHMIFDLVKDYANPQFSTDIWLEISSTIIN